MLLTAVEKPPDSVSHEDDPIISSRAPAKYGHSPTQALKHAHT